VVDHVSAVTTGIRRPALSPCAHRPLPQNLACVFLKAHRNSRCATRNKVLLHAHQRVRTAAFCRPGGEVIDRYASRTGGEFAKGVGDLTKDEARAFRTATIRQTDHRAKPVSNWGA